MRLCVKVEESARRTSRALRTNTAASAPDLLRQERVEAVRVLCRPCSARPTDDLAQSTDDENREPPNAAADDEARLPQRDEAERDEEDDRGR